MDTDSYSSGDDDDDDEDGDDGLRSDLPSGKEQPTFFSDSSNLRADRLETIDVAMGSRRSRDMKTSKKSVTSRLKDSVSSFGSAVVSKVEDLFGNNSGEAPSECDERTEPIPQSMDLPEPVARAEKMKNKRSDKKMDMGRMSSRSASGMSPAPPPAPCAAPAPRTAPAPTSLLTSTAAKLESPLPPKATAAMELIVHAQANGCFLLDASLASLLGHSLSTLLDLAPASLKHLPDVWATALVLASLQLNFAATKDEWGLIHSKGRKFIAKAITSHSIEATVDSLIQSASQAL